ncbi:hypothetical protein [Phycicoccus sp. DTK01]|uniref:hypothetical protein n=1 Tax=Phycicoccus sp. DTK01 TaxID=2785745 RepID=UPI001A8DFB33|nr:hypothetical protein [Phycicoccus sp. DTK01]GIL34022.1 hypothetical protein PDTK01_00990 [Phycicoccus sp. DTK01]
MSQSAPAGWYPQPDGSRRWWTGSSWAEVSAPGAGPVVHGEVVAFGSAPTAHPVPSSYPVPPDRPAPLVAGPYGYSPMMQVAPKSPGLAVLASFFLPGLGQFVNGQGAKGFAFLFSCFVGFLLLAVVIGVFVLPVVWVWSMVDAYSSAQAWNARHGILS